jgi:ABC-type polysaccharide/polyol phosphate transport system ATPase subunit
VNAIEFRGVSKSYAIYDSPGDRLTELLCLNRLRRHRDFLALDAVSFSVERGETFCIVGQNGAGKSTLLEIVAGISPPSAGTAEVNGRVSALLELGAGFNPQFSGRDNVYLNAAIHGLTTRQIEDRYRAIADFAEIGDFINQPVKTYSSGMAVRLAFAVAIHTEPEILLVDEALAVGDLYFRQKCMRKVHELRARGVTILLVSHSAADVKAIADRAMWLDGGRVAALGDPDRVLGQYLAAMVDKDSKYLHNRAEAAEGAGAAEALDTLPNVDHRRGDGRAEVLGIGILDEQGRPLRLLDPRSRILVRITARAKAEIRRPIVGFVLRNQLGMDFSGADTEREGHALQPMRAGETSTTVFHIDLPELYPASFSFSPFIADGSVELAACDWVDNAVTLQMSKTEGQIYGYVRLPCRVEMNQRLRHSDGAPAAERTVG